MQLMQVAPSCGQFFNSCKWRHLVAKFETNESQGTYRVHYSLIFIVYTILFTICTLLKLYTIGYIAGSGGKKPRILVQNEPAQLHNQDGRRPAPNPEDVRGTRLAIKNENASPMAAVRLKAERACSGAGLPEDCQGLPGKDCGKD